MMEDSDTTLLGYVKVDQESLDRLVAVLASVGFGPPKWTYRDHVPIRELAPTLCHHLNFRLQRRRLSPHHEKAQMRTSRVRRSLLHMTLWGALLPSTIFAQDAPDWAEREFEATSQQVYAASLQSIQLRGHKFQAKDESRLTVDFHVGMSAMSWGYNMKLVVTPISEDRSKVTVGVRRSGGKALSWGSGQKEVKKILAFIDAELASAKPDTPSPIERSKSSPVMCTVQVQSEPAGADVELDGAFVGNTPTTLRLKPGDYTIVVKKTGYDDWKRKLTAIEDNEHTVRAELTKTP